MKIKLDNHREIKDFRCEKAYLTDIKRMLAQSAVQRNLINRDEAFRRINLQKL